MLRVAWVPLTVEVAKRIFNKLVRVFSFTAEQIFALLLLESPRSPFESPYLYYLFFYRKSIIQRIKVKTIKEIKELLLKRLFYELPDVLGVCNSSLHHRPSSQYDNALSF